MSSKIAQKNLRVKINWFSVDTTYLTLAKIHSKMGKFKFKDQIIGLGRCLRAYTVYARK